MSNVFVETSRLLEQQASKTPDVLVAYSGGKDSLAVLDLCTRAFQRVVAFHMYFIPGLACIEEQMQFAKERWGVTVLQYPHWVFLRCLKDSVFCPPYPALDELSEWKLGDIHRLVTTDTGISTIAHGGKLADSLWRRRQLGNAKGMAGRDRSDTRGVIYPIKHWSKWDTLGYLAKQKIPIPQQDSQSNSGVDLTTPSVLWLHDKHPADYQKLCDYFPYAPAIVRRREWFGVE